MLKGWRSVKSLYSKDPSSCIVYAPLMEESYLVFHLVPDLAPDLVPHLVPDFLLLLVLHWFPYLVLQLVPYLVLH